MTDTQAMMVERHYDDESLIAIMEADRVRGDDHLPSCTVCNEKLESFRTISTALHDNAIWDTREVRTDPNPNTIATLRAFADRMSAEDAAATHILPQLLAGPREEWMPRLREHPEWRTAGVVRGLGTRMRQVLPTNPPDALEMTVLATTISNELSDAGYTANTVARLRAAAWRENAYALFYVGRFSDAAVAADKAEAFIRTCLVDEYDAARIGVVKALILRAKEEFSQATDIVRESAATFVRFSDSVALVSARIAESHLLFSRSDFEAAAQLLEDLRKIIETTDDANLHARVLANLGYCYWKLGRVEEALMHHDAAASLLDLLRVHTEAVRVRWNVASILVSAGRFDDALPRLNELRGAFDALHMRSEAALVRLDIAEILLDRGAFDEVDALCRAAMAAFEAGGISYSTRALTALAYIREAAQHRRATAVLVRHVKEYIRRLPQDGELIFAPPPLPPERPNSR